MRLYVSFFLLILFLTSFSDKLVAPVVYKLQIEAKGCHYQVSMNGKMIAEGKSYQTITKSIDLSDELIDSIEQKVDVTMLRVSRDLPLKATKGYVHVKLEKVVKDSSQIIKELNLPTFPYDDDEIQPQSIGGSIRFSLDKSKGGDEKVEEKLVNKLGN